MNEREVLDKRFASSGITEGSVVVPSFETVPVKYSNVGRAQNIRQCLFYMRRNRGISYSSLDCKGKIIRKFMAFLVNPIVAKQNEIDSKYTDVLNELYEVSRRRAQLIERLNVLEDKLNGLES